MDTLNIHAAKTHFSGLVERAEKGETIIIARAGKPVAKLTPLETGVTDRVAMAARRIGFMKGEFSIPDDFNEMGREEIERMFNGDDKG
ncbi:type II toxin-antitoxin system Phd/YefM family antitoxin [Brevundimonas sp.]|uniref:type II toxin-antitoxin system Phd/YefM family antitoxin n=1 Tax=Brevundimonas sp. TaxID=1871086 RepID=UPI0026275DD8|nr:type II toxin-antitoxin system Phd/YefM family antitoxin [Brevundimonas sp.]